MKKTSLYVDDDVDAALARLAAAEGTSKAEVIRRALSAAAAMAPTPPILGLGALDFDAIPPEEIDAELGRTGFGE